MRHIPKLNTLILVMGTFLFSACATPLAIKDLSSEQLTAQQQFRTALTALLERMQEIVSNQVQVIEQEIELTNKRRLEGGAKLVESSQMTPEEFAAAYMAETKVRADLLVRAKQNLAKLKSAHARLLTTYDDMIKAQQTLDQYLRLEKADEVAANSILASLGIRRQQVDAALEVAAEALRAYEGNFEQSGTPTKTPGQ